MLIYTPKHTSHTVISFCPVLDTVCKSLLIAVTQVYLVKSLEKGSLCTLDSKGPDIRTNCSHAGWTWCSLRAKGVSTHASFRFC